MLEISGGGKVKPLEVEMKEKMISSIRRGGRQIVLVVQMSACTVQLCGVSVQRGPDMDETVRKVGRIEGHFIKLALNAPLLQTTATGFLARASYMIRQWLLLQVLELLARTLGRREDGVLPLLSQLEILKVETASDTPNFGSCLEGLHPSILGFLVKGFKEGGCGSEGLPLFIASTIDNKGLLPLTGIPP
jgi:hypothetical protein